MTSNHGPRVTGLPHSNAKRSTEESYRIEVIRKAIHFSSLSIPLCYYYTPRTVALTVLLPLAGAFILVDLGRYSYRPVEMWFGRTFGRLLRSHESDRNRKRLNGATYVLFAAALTVLIFPKFIAVSSLFILIISDTIAALVGKRFGKHTLFNKSWEGTIAFFLSALIVITLLPKLEYQPEEYLIGLFAAAAGAIVEALPIDLDDNLTIPLAVGLVLWAGYALFLPSVNIHTFG